MAFLDLHYWSDAIGMQTSAYVILPQTAGPHHVLFLLHGRSDDHTIWMRRTSIERYVEGLNLMVVMPNGHRGFYLNQADGYAYGDAVTEELPSLVEQWFRVHPRFAISGLSMGGYGAVRSALVRPDRFVSAVSHSGALFRFDNGYGEGRAMDREFIRTFGEDPDGGPGDLYALTSAAKTYPKLRIDCGTEDFLIEDNRQYHRFLKNSGVAHEYAEFSGGHTWDYWDAHVSEGIAFHRRNLGF
ncbi:MAG: alpha/beta hydrolase family protein [Fimbriimonadaceae bacterium]|nr:alpha/beta hydrolase family protein [Fimbriimonadaceae bacterium]